MTEEQAKTKWCFAAVASHTDPRSGFHEQDPNWPADQPKTFGCIASACMAWRLLEDRHEYIDLPKGEEPEGEGWAQDGEGLMPTDLAWARKLTNRGGYCGLAGAPQ